MILRCVERLEGRKLYSTALPAGAHLVWSNLDPGVAGEPVALAIKLESRAGAVIPVSNLPVHFSLGGASSASSWNARLQDGSATINVVMPRRAGRYRLSAGVRGRSTSKPFDVLGAAAVRMRLVGSGLLDHGEYAFTLQFRDRFGNLATSDTSTLSFKVHTLLGSVPILENDTFRISGILSPRSVQVGNAGMNPGYANLEIIAQGENYDPATDSTTPAQVSVEFDDSNPAIPPVFSPVWDAGD